VRPTPAIPAETALARHRGRVALALAYGFALAAALGVGRGLHGREPLWVAAFADVIATGAVFLVSMATNNSSIYDPYWSVAPIPVVLYWASVGGFRLRAVLVVVLVCAWGVRLTANQLLRWRGLLEEDFRYRELRRRTGRAYWAASLVGIHLLPTAWVFLGLVPLYPALALPSRPLGPLDGLAVALASFAIALEAAADLQLRRFLARRNDRSEILSRGLWALCRHPNYLGEILFWWGLFLFGLSAAPHWAWAAIGPAAITLLFLLVSVPWMDRRMREGHAAYEERLRSTPSLLPWPRRRPS